MVGQAVKVAIESYDTTVLGTEITFDDVDLSFAQGRISVKGLKVQNPGIDGTEWKSHNLMEVDNFTFDVNTCALCCFWRGLFVEEMRLEGIRINFDKPKLFGKSNAGHVLETVSQSKEDDVEAKTVPRETTSSVSVPDAPMQMIEMGALAVGLNEARKMVEDHFEAPEPQVLPADGKAKKLSVKKLSMTQIKTKFFMNFSQLAELDMGDVHVAEFGEKVHPMPCELKYVLRFICKTLMATVIANYSTFYKAESKLRQQLRERLDKAEEAAKRAADEAARGVLGDKATDQLEASLQEAKEGVDKQIAGAKHVISDMRQGVDDTLHVQEKVDKAKARVHGMVDGAEVALGHMLDIGGDAPSPSPKDESATQPRVGDIVRVLYSSKGHKGKEGKIIAADKSEMPFQIEGLDGWYKEDQVQQVTKAVTPAASKPVEAVGKPVEAVASPGKRSTSRKSDVKPRLITVSVEPATGNDVRAVCRDIGGGVIARLVTGREVALDTLRGKLADKLGIPLASVKLINEKDATPLQLDAALESLLPQ